MSINNYLIDNFENADNWTQKQGIWTVVNGEYQTNGSGETITQANNFSAKDLIFECYLRLGSNGDAGVTVRSTNGIDGYFISFRPSAGAIWVYDLPDSTSILARNDNAGVVANDWVRIRIIMLSNQILVYYNDMGNPKISFSNNNYSIVGGLFLRSYYNQAAYKEVKLYENINFNTETCDSQLLTKWIPYRNDFSINNERVYSSGENIDILIANTGNMSDFILEADMRIDTDGDCGFMLRTNDAASEDGYYVGFHPFDNRCYIWELNGGNGIANREAWNLNITKSVFHHVKIICYKEDILVYFDDMLTPIITAYSTTRLSGRIGIRSYHAECYFDNIEIRLFKPSLIQNVRVFTFDHIFESIGEWQGKSVSEYYEYYSPKMLIYTQVSTFLEATSYNVYYRVVEWTDTNSFPPQKTRPTYTESTFLQAFPKADKDNWNPVTGPSWDFDYSGFVTQYDLVNQVNSSVIDEVWVVGDWDGSMFEAMMVGDNPFYINGYPLQIAGAKNFAIMGNNFERNFDMGLHNFGHRIEQTLGHVYGRCIVNDDVPPTGPLPYSNLNNPEKFLLVKYQIGSHVTSNSNPIVGCGNTHYPPNRDFSATEISNGDIKPAGSIMDKLESVDSNFLYWMNYTDSNYAITRTDKINCLRWGCRSGGEGEGNYLKWWFSCIPNFDGINIDGKYNNWWKYILLKEE